MIVGVDIGGSITKAVLMKRSDIISMTMSKTLEDPLTSLSGVLGKVVSQASLQLSDIDCIAVSGGKSRLLPNALFGLSIVKVNEIESIGTGGLTLSKRNHALVASLGTGTAIVWARDSGRSVVHVGGTGVGGGTIMGLGRQLIGIGDVSLLAQLARTGSPKAVNLTVDDIVGSGVGILNPSVTASNFGRIDGSTRREDLAAGLFSMAGEVIGVVLHLASDSVKENDIVLVGTLSTIQEIASVVKRTLGYFGKDAEIPAMSEYCVAVGSAVRLASQRGET